MAVELNLGLFSKQAMALKSTANELLYGGAAGGGKSHFARVISIVLALDIPGIQIYLFRRKSIDLEKNHLEAPKGYRRLLQPLVDEGLVRIVKGEIRFENKSKIFLCHCQHEKDRFNYQGPEIHYLIVEEVTQFTGTIYRFLRSRVRAPGLSIPEQWKQKVPGILATGNPGGVGHQFVKKTWIDFAQPFEIVDTSDEDGGMRRQFIPALLEDNPQMLQDDPRYEARLLGIGGKLAQAMRWGRWDMVEGAFFDEFDPSMHVIKTQPVPIHWTKYRSTDWGSYRPFSHDWWTCADGQTDLLDRNGAKFTPPRGSMICYRSWYGKKSDNIGLKMTPEAVAAGVCLRQSTDEVFSASVADREFFNKGRGKSIFEMWLDYGLSYTRAQDDRKQGWQVMRSLMALDEELSLPKFYIMEWSTDLIRTLPVLLHDEKNPEDIDTDLEDHAADSARYACMIRYAPQKKERDTYEELKGHHLSPIFDHFNDETIA